MWYVINSSGLIFADQSKELNRGETLLDGFRSLEEAAIHEKREI